MPNATIRRSVLGSLVIVALAVTVWSAVAQAGPAPTPTPSSHYCEIDIKCSDESGEGPKDDYCYVVPVGDIIFYYDFIGGEAEITDSRLGVIGIYTGTTLTRTVTYSESVTHVATFEPIGTVCTHGIFSDFVTVVHGQPTPTVTPTVTPTTSPTITPTATATPTPIPTPTLSEKVTVCHKGKNLISVPANAVPGHLAHGDTLGAVQCLECEFPVSGTFCACNDSWPKCMRIPPFCPLGTVLAAQNDCWACVDPFTCRPVER